MTQHLQAIQAGFSAASIPQELVDELLTSFIEAKRRFHLGDLRPNIIEGGRFSEAAFRILQWATNAGNYTPIGQSLPGVPTLLGTLSRDRSINDSLRLHIPRTLQSIYEVRNNRNAAHLGVIDPNLQDSSLVIHVMDWVLAEFVRLYNNVAPDLAQSMINDLVAKEVPAMQLFDGFPRILKDVSQTEHLLILLYWRGMEGAKLAELSGWVTDKTAKARISTNLQRLSSRHLIHKSGDLVRITIPGEHEVERKRLIEPA